MRDAIVAEARAWLGTPYRHQASAKGAGCDCLGLLLGVWTALGQRVPPVPPYSPDWDEVAKCDVLHNAARRILAETTLDDMQSGDVLLFRMRRGAVAKHLGIVSGPTQFIHAYSGHGVVESRLSEPWRRRIAGVFTVPDITKL